MENNRNASVTIGTDNVVISESKNILANYRSNFSIINTSTAGQIINITFTDEAGSGTGVQLSAGGFYGESISEGFFPTNERICAISNAAGGTLAVMERIIFRPIPSGGR